MKKTSLKKLNRYELLTIMYDLRKENDELRSRCETAEAQAAKLTEEAERRKTEGQSINVLNERLQALEQHLRGSANENRGGDDKQYFNQTPEPNPALNIGEEDSHISNENKLNQYETTLNNLVSGKVDEIQL